MVVMRLIIGVWCFTTVLLAAAPQAELLNTKKVHLCADTACVPIMTEARTLKIIAPASGATAYLVDVIVAGSRPGERRTMSFLVRRAEQSYGRYEDRTTATFFTLPLDLDVAILDIWVDALVTTGEPFHKTGDK
jgi:hypothetical protein